MKVLSVLVSFAVLSLCLGVKFVSFDEVKELILKYGRQNFTKQEHETLLDVFEVIQAPEYFSGNEIKSNGVSLRSALPCIICNAAFGVLFDLVHEGKSDQYIGFAITQLCTDLGIYDYNVCHGVVDLNIPIMTYIIRHTPEAKPQTFCSLIVQSNEDPNNCRLTDPRFEWTVDLPETSSKLPVVKESDRTKPYTFVIVTDPHIDPLYEAFGVANCGEPTCCRKGQKPTTRKTRKPVDESLIDSSIISSGFNHGIDLDKVSEIRKSKKMRKPMRNKDNSPAGYWGDYRSCDTPIWAFDDVIDRITETHTDIDAVYYIGDSIDHGVWETSYELIQGLNEHVANKFRKGFGDDVLIVPSIGNHESQPTNQFAPTHITEEKLNTTWLYKNLGEKWSHYLTEEAKESLAKNGAFSVLFKDKLRIISINNNIAYRYNWWLVYDPLDSKNHLEWLIDELYKAEKAGERVHILAHIPPGVNDLTHTWTREYNKVINRFSSTIAAEFNGHTHTDEFRIYYNLTDSTQPINVAWGAGGATAYANYNLNYKIITLDSNTYELNSMTNYIYNLTEANLTPNKRPHWFQLYDFGNSFGLKEFSAASLNDLVYRMAANEKTLLSLYAAYFSKLSDTKWPYCDTNCQADYLCKMVITVLWDRRKCEELKGLYLTTIRKSQRQLNLKRIQQVKDNLLQLLTKD